MSLIEKAVERLEALPGKVAEPGASGDGGASLAPSELARDVDGRTGARAATSKEVSQRLELDLGKLRAAGIIVPNALGSQIAEEFRILKRPLLTNVINPPTPVRNANLIMVTSSLPGEGKTFTAINLAMSIAAELDRTVLLVDTDVARPSLPRVLGLPEQKGLLDALQDKSLKLSDVMVRTNIDKLSILTSGAKDLRATELLASEAMGRLLNEMARRYADRIIIFDSPPLLVTTEARALAARMGQIVFVVRAEHTPQNAVKEALATIESCPVKLMVLNQTRSEAENVAYGYDYGFGY